VSWRLADTDDRARAVQLDIYRAMTPEQRSALASEMSDDMMRRFWEGVRARHPDADELTIRREGIRRLHGDAVADAIR
jgi:hypothetical protein